MNLKYKEIEDRILTNIGEKKANQDKLADIIHDIQDVFLVDIHGKSEAPRKVMGVNVQELTTLDIPLDILMLENFTIVDNALITNSEVASTLTLGKFSDINELKFLTYSEIGGQELVGLIKLTAENGDILHSSVFNIIDDGRDWQSVTIPIAKKGYNMTLQIVVPAGQAQLKSFSFTKTWNVIELPEDFYIPLEVKFSSGLKIFQSSEITAEEFLNWNTLPGLAERTDDVTAIDDNPLTVGLTRENIIYDGKIGYYFEYVEGKVFLHFKPKFTGVIEIYYAYVPIILVADGTQAPIHRMYADLLIAGATVKGLYRKLLDVGGNDQFKYMGIKSNIDKYDKDFKQLLATYAGWVNRKADTPRIDPFTFLSDSSMELYQ